MFNEQEHYINFLYNYIVIVIMSLLMVALFVPPTVAVLAINGCHTLFLDFFFASLTNLGNGLILVPFMILLSFRSLHLSIGLIVSGIVDGVIVSLCKRVFFSSAARPMAEIDHTHAYAVPGVAIHHAMSFPSGHSVTIFGLCVFLSLCYRNNFVTGILMTLALFVAVSRVYLLQHFVMDIACGAVIGSVVGILTFQWMEQLTKPQWMNQCLEIRLKKKEKTASVSEHNRF